MASKKIVLKPFINKRTKQISFVIPKKQAKLSNPSIKFGDELFVRIELLQKKK